MLSFDALRERLDAPERIRAGRGLPRPGGRIITAERLGGYAPFAMHDLSLAAAGPRDPGDGGRDGGRDGARDGARRDDRAPWPAPRDAAPRPAGDPFERFADDAGSHPLERDGFDAGYRAGHEAGYAQGLERGYETGTEHAQRQQRHAEEQAGLTLAQRVEALRGALDERFAALERDAADQVIALALEVARHALRTTLALRPESIVPVVQEALSSLLDERVRMHLFLNPRDAELVRGELGDRLAARNCEIVPDPSIEPGGCRIETPRAEVDATVATRWRRTLAAIGREADAAAPGEPSA